jgi:hypothetical protein
MKNLFAVLVTILVALGGLGAAHNTTQQSESTEQHLHLEFTGDLLLQQNNDYLSVNLEGTNSYLKESGTPRLPIFITTLEFSRNAKIHGVTCSHGALQETQLTSKVLPNAVYQPLSQQDASAQPIIKENPAIYESAEMYPATWYTYTVRCGLNTQGIPTTFVIIEIYPVRYNPQENILSHVDTVDLQISYSDPVTHPPSQQTSSTDLVIIAPEIFSDSLQPLIEHKNNHGLTTILKTTEEIYSEYTGRDKPEQIKYYIKDAKESLGAQYILLMGGLNNFWWAKDKDDQNQGSSAWYVPVRYTNIRGQDADEYGTPSDLYYADLYRYNQETEQWEFEDWDSNGNNVFAEWLDRPYANDVLDLMPDINVTRLACRNINEVETVVDKIITYESTSPQDKSWYNKMILIAGRTFVLENGEPDGEVVCDKALEYMDPIVDSSVKVYASNINTGGPVPVADDIIQALSEGAGYVNFEGHGFTPGWNTNWPEESPDDWHNWTGGIRLDSYPKIKNGDKLPVIIVGGCHNGLFNVTMFRALLFKALNHPHFYHASFYPTPECFSWRLVSKPNGGAIASTGCTGYGFGDDTAITLSAELEVNFFYEIGQDGQQTLGAAHSGSITKYITENPINKIDEHCIVVYEMFGDPSLVLGGYP